jgi:hypothetical protein
MSKTSPAKHEERMRQSNEPADAVAITGASFEAATSQTPSRCPRNSETNEVVTRGALKLETILLVWTFNFCAGLIFCACPTDD